MDVFLAVVDIILDAEVAQLAREHGAQPTTPKPRP
jgi:hypothetical protein